MKKTTTLFAIAILLSAATFAQRNQSHDRGYDVVMNEHDHGDRSFDRGTYYFSPRERDMEISAINREYFNKIQSVKGRIFMSHGKKEQIIRMLEMQRSKEVRSVLNKFNDRKNRYDRSHDRYDDHGGKGKW